MAETPVKLVCRNCIYLSKIWKYDTEVNICRRFPPRRLPNTRPQSRFPPINDPDFDWCGEHKKMM